MQRLLILIFVSMTSASWCQVEMNNSNSAGAESVEEAEKEQVIDSTRIQNMGGAKGDTQIVKERSSKDMKNKQGAYKKAELEPASEKKQQQSAESISYGFKYSKQQSSVQRTQRSPTPVQQTQMDDAVEYFETNSPNTFEHHYFTYVAGNYDVSLIDHLNKAEEMRPNNADVQIQKAGYAMITGDVKKGMEYIAKLIKSQRLGESSLLYAEDLLISAPKNGVLITHGFDDSYATWYVQNKNKTRTDVELVSLDFLQSEAYRKGLSKKGFDLPKNNVIDVDYLEEFCSLNVNKSLSISMTTPKEYLLPLKNDLYVTGLVFEYQEETYSNHSRNKELWNSQLKKHLVDNATDQKAKQLSSNYLPMLLLLREIYQKKGDAKTVKEIDKDVDKVSVQCNKYEQVQKLKKAY